MTETKLTSTDVLRPCEALSLLIDHWEVDSLISSYLYQSTDYFQAADKLQQVMSYCTVLTLVSHHCEYYPNAVAQLTLTQIAIHFTYPLFNIPSYENPAFKCSQPMRSQFIIPTGTMPSKFSSNNQSEDSKAIEAPWLVIHSCLRIAPDALKQQQAR